MTRTYPRTALLQAISRATASKKGFGIGSKVCVVVVNLCIQLTVADVPEEMVEIPAGAYTPMYIERAEERPVSGFLLDRRPVTNGQFLEFVRANPKWRRSAVKRLFADEAYLAHWGGDLDLGPNGDRIADSPVTHVSWFAARAYLKTVGKRLPSEDEWEYVARADETRADASKDPRFTARLLDWYGRPSPAILPSVADEAPNVYGVSGLHGVVWEWVRDFNNAMVTGESRGDSSLERGLYCAGGALGTTDPRNYAAFMRYAFRSSLQGAYAVPNLGFRGARSIERGPVP